MTRVSFVTLCSCGLFARTPLSPLPLSCFPTYYILIIHSTLYAAPCGPRTASDEVNLSAWELVLPLCILLSWSIKVHIYPTPD